MRKIYLIGFFVLYRNACNWGKLEMEWRDVDEVIVTSISIFVFYSCISLRCLMIGFWKNNYGLGGNYDR